MFLDTAFMKMCHSKFKYFYDFINSFSFEHSISYEEISYF